MTDDKSLSESDYSIAEQRAVAIYDRIAQQKVTNIETYLLMGDLVKEVKSIVNKFEEETRPEIEQAHRLHKALIAKRDKWADKFAEAEQLAKDKIRHYAETNDAPKIEGITVGEAWDGEVIDAEKIPREYLTPDIKKLKDLTKVLKQEMVVPGWKVKSVKIISVRS